MGKELSTEEIDQRIEEQEAVHREYGIFYSLISSAAEMVAENGPDGQKLSRALVEQGIRFEETIKKYEGVSLS